MTERIYFSQPNIYTLEATIIDKGVDSKGVYLILNRSIYYPQGGGQPADTGSIFIQNKHYEVYDVRHVDGEIRHYISCDLNTCLPQAAQLKINQARRMLNTRYHTAGHLIAAVVENMDSDLSAIKGHQFPGEACIELTRKPENIDQFMAQLSSELTMHIESQIRVETKIIDGEEMQKVLADLTYSVPNGETLRVCCISVFPPVPCGGTHVDSLVEIGIIDLVKLSSKRGRTKIYYEVR